MAHVQQKPEKTGDIAEAMLAHYERHARILPWRKRPGEGRPDPYHVWMSEIMLQQTTVAAVGRYFERFTDDWPDIASLAAAKDADVMAAWAGLGYYARARNLIACARTVVAEHGAILPATEAALLKLPGVGAYTAAAIAAIAFGERAVVVDANIERVVSRLFAISTPLPAAKAEIRAAMDDITPDQNVGDFAQAMMDLGATICTPKAPLCTSCPISGWCAAFKAGNQEAYPVKAAKKAKRQRTGTAYWIERNGHIWLVRRAGSGMLAGMRALPDDGWNARASGDGTVPGPGQWQILSTKVSHVFTHFSLALSIAVTAWPDGIEPPGDGEWWPVNSLDKAGLPTLFKKAVGAVRSAHSGGELHAAA